MYNPKDLNANGRYDYDERTRCLPYFESFSIGIFRWVLKGNGKSLKKESAKVRVVGGSAARKKMLEKCEEIRKQLDAGTYKGPKTVRVTV